jgi:hypothetical protein
MIADYALDAALERIAADASRIDITTSKPSTYADVMRSSLGYTTAFKVSRPRACSGGRCCDVTAGSDGTVTKAGTPRYWVITGKGHLLACGEITDARAVSTDMMFRLPPVCCELLEE